MVAKVRRITCANVCRASRTVQIGRSRKFGRSSRPPSSTSGCSRVPQAAVAKVRQPRGTDSGRSRKFGGGRMTSLDVSPRRIETRPLTRLPQFNVQFSNSLIYNKKSRFEAACGAKWRFPADLLVANGLEFQGFLRL